MRPSRPLPPPPSADVLPHVQRRKRVLIDRAAEKLLALLRRHRPPTPSVSQCGQDIFVAQTIFRRKRGGFFLEIGGGDGRYLSNTLILETYFDWKGILVEPTSAYDQLVKNRPGATCVRAAVSDKRGTVRVVEVMDKGQVFYNPDAAEGNTLLSVVEDAEVESAYEPPDFGDVKGSFLVEAVTLDDLLTEARAPSTIDYFSFDVENSEYRILKDFPFDKWRFNCIGVERPSEELDKLLTDNGYFLIRDGFPLDWFYLRRDFMEEWFAGID